MTDPARRPRYSFREYVLLEEYANLRHEFLGGEIYAMAGGTPEHAALAMNAGALLRELLHGRGCRVHSSDLRIRVIETGLATYPDVTVVCGHVEIDPEDRNTVTNPIVLLEVTSPSSEGYDRGEKLAHYRRIPSLRAVVIVSHAERRIDVWRRGDDGAWAVVSAGEGERAAVEAIGCELAVEDVYRDDLTGRSLV